MALRDAADLLAPAVEETISSLTLEEADAAAVKLARRYAAAIDDDADPLRPALDVYGPKLLTALNALGATPAGRARLRGGAPNRVASRLEVLRAARR